MKIALLCLRQQKNHIAILHLICTLSGPIKSISDVENTIFSSMKFGEFTVNCKFERYSCARILGSLYLKFIYKC